MYFRAKLANSIKLHVTELSRNDIKDNNVTFSPRSAFPISGSNFLRRRVGFLVSSNKSSKSNERFRPACVCVDLPQVTRLKFYFTAVEEHR